VPELVNDIDISETSDLPCGAVLLQSNTFEESYGCPYYTGAVVAFECVTEADYAQIGNNDDLGTSVTDLRKYSENTSNAETLASLVFSSDSFTSTDTLLTIAKYRAEFKDNSFSGSYVSNEEGVLAIYGALFAYLEGNSFLDSYEVENADLQALITNNNMAAITPTSTTNSDDDNQALGVILFYNCFGITIDSLSIETAEMKAAKAFSSYQSMAISVMSSGGHF